MSKQHCLLQRIERFCRQSQTLFRRCCFFGNNVERVFREICFDFVEWTKFHEKLTNVFPEVKYHYSTARWAVRTWLCESDGQWRWFDDVSDDVSGDVDVMWRVRWDEAAVQLSKESEQLSTSPRSIRSAPYKPGLFSIYNVLLTQHNAPATKVEALSEAALRPSVCLSFCSMPVAQNGAF